jgi:BirA family transcriptional regulator, biotin operon repressor / biotin---[acetyl-CoA-carboxylase] ligase
VLTPVAFTLLRQLADGGVHSGEALALTVGMTRARVSQLLKQVEGSGLSLERIRGRGYRLLDATPFLDRAAIMRSLDARAGPLQVEVADQVDSTSSELLRRNPGTDIHRLLLAAEWQTAGRGRRGRQWTSVVGGSLTFSLGWRFEQGAAFLSGLSLAVGVAIARALEASGFTEVLLEWPNDLVHRQRKLGGILIELSGDALGPSLVVVGVGMNVRLPDSVRGAIDQPVTDLSASGAPIDRNVLLARIAAEIAMALAHYGHEGFAGFREDWQRRHALQHKRVDVLLPDGSVMHGSVVGVDADGALLLDDGGRRLRLVNGEVSLRRAQR